MEYFGELLADVVRGTIPAGQLSASQQRKVVAEYIREESLKTQQARQQNERILQKMGNVVLL